MRLVRAVALLLFLACCASRGNAYSVLTHEEMVDLLWKDGNTEGAATLGFTAAMAAYGGFFIPKSYGTSISLTGGPEAALYVFFVFYLVCIGITWWNYARRNAPTPC